MILCFAGESFEGGFGFMAVRTIALLAVGTLAVVVLIAARQSAFLLIDIADTLLHEHSKSRNA